MVFIISASRYFILKQGCSIFPETLTWSWIRASHKINNLYHRQKNSCCQLAVVSEKYASCHESFTYIVAKQTTDKPIPVFPSSKYPGNLCKISKIRQSSLDICLIQNQNQNSLTHICGTRGRWVDKIHINTAADVPSNVHWTCTYGV